MRIFLTIVSLLFLNTNIFSQNPQKGDYGYLYCHMSGKGEWTAYALSRDGLHYEDLLNGEAVYDNSKLCAIEGGARDAYICRSFDCNSYLMVTTDMSNAKSHNWFNYGINLLKSDDLIHWTSVTFDFRKGSEIFSDPQSPDFYKDYTTIQRVWAPQIFWNPSYVWTDGKIGGYMIYYSLLNSAEDKYDRVFYSYADESFTKLTKPKLLFDWGYATIDADINFVPADGKYHLLIKKEGGTSGIFTATSDQLIGPYNLGDENDYVKFEGNKKCEGCSAFQLIGDSTWRVAYIEYSSRPKHYRICKADKYLSNFSDPVDMIGVEFPQHGSFLQLTQQEYLRLKNWSDKRSDNH